MQAEFARNGMQLPSPFKHGYFARKYFRSFQKMNIYDHPIGNYLKAKCSLDVQKKIRSFCAVKDIDFHVLFDRKSMEKGSFKVEHILFS